MGPQGEFAEIPTDAAIVGQVLCPGGERPIPSHIWKSRGVCVALDQAFGNGPGARRSERREKIACRLLQGDLERQGVGDYQRVPNEADGAVGGASWTLALDELAGTLDDVKWEVEDHIVLICAETGIEGAVDRVGERVGVNRCSI